MRLRHSTGLVIGSLEPAAPYLGKAERERELLRKKAERKVNGREGGV